MPQIPYGKKEGEELPQDGCQGSAKDSPAKDKDKYRVKDGIDDCPGHHTEHGIFGVSVRPDEIAHAVGENEKGHPDQGDAGILPGIGQYLRGCPEQL